jgi:hypothetical protein
VNLRQQFVVRLLLIAAQIMADEEAAKLITEFQNQLRLYSSEVAK